MDSGGTRHIPILREHICRDFRGRHREAGEVLKFRLIVPVSDQYSDVPWNRDSWLTNAAPRQAGSPEDRRIWRGRMRSAGPLPVIERNRQEL